MNRKSKMRECSHKSRIITAFLGIILSFVLIFTNFAGLYPASVKADSSEFAFVSAEIVAPDSVEVGEEFTIIYIFTFSRPPSTDEDYRNSRRYNCRVLGDCDCIGSGSMSWNENVFSPSFTYIATAAGNLSCEPTFLSVVRATKTITVTPATHTVDVSNDEHGTAVASPESAAAGTQITLTATPDANYRFKEWQVISGNITITNNSFTMPSEDVQVRAIFETIPSGGGMSPGSGGDGNSTPGGGGTPPAPSSSDSGPSVIDTAISKIKAAKDGDIVIINSNYATNDLMNALIEKPGVTAVFIFERNGNTISVFIKNPIIENTVDIYGPENLVGIHNRCVARDFKVEQNPHMTPEEIREYVQALILDARNARMGIAPVVPVPIDDGRAGLTATVDPNGISTYASMGGGSLRYITG